ncbi:hypothetical protein DSO57_1003475 [Entomophthora muscae]|uniref:Uncharacterized protein n=1 Tax=Entomophthora muscae TaxID=34485 RepID=A0ACC2UTU1_9FUNG|nr:hypothetical protein DSO57_1003475 [Entomophthora muscae]
MSPVKLGLGSVSLWLGGVYALSNLRDGSRCGLGPDSNDGHCGDPKVEGSQVEGAGLGGTRGRIGAGGQVPTHQDDEAGVNEDAGGDGVKDPHCQRGGGVLRVQVTDADADQDADWRDNGEGHNHHERFKPATQLADAHPKRYPLKELMEGDGNQQHQELFARGYSE